MNEAITDGILNVVKKERQRQEALKKEGRFSFTPDEVPLSRSYEMLMEEVGEVARCILSIDGYVPEVFTVHDCRSELIQVAAIAVAMVEWIETQEPDKLSLA
jgi:NTP pyrophosphatase (non-canonical NTP hydrolase)